MKRRMMAPLAVTAAIAAGSVAGAMIGVPGVSGAQEAQEDAPAPPEAGPRGPMRGPFEAAADALGLEVDALMTRLRAGETIAEVAAAEGVDVETVIDAMVADAVEKSGRSEEELRERITALVNEGLPPGGPGGHRGPGGPGRGPGMHRRGGGPGLDAAAEALGMEPEELRDALRDGQTIAEVAQEKGVDVDTVIDAMVSEAREHIEDFVNNGPHKPEPPADEAPDAEVDAEGSSLAS